MKNKGTHKMEFKKYKLEEICSLYQPQTISGKEILSRGKFLVYGANGIIGYYDSYNHEDCEIAMTCRGATCGNIIWTKPRSWITGNAMVVHPTSSVVDKRYLYYFLKEKKMSRAITGSAQPQITRSDLEFFEVLLPPLAEQKKIAGTLALIDRKIELCEAQNRTLEKLARQIYDYWFVQFDFPDENGRPYKSSGGKMVYNEKLKREIPEGWETRTVGEIASVKKGELITESIAKTGKIKVVAAGIDHSYLHNVSNREKNTITISASGANAGFVRLWLEPIFASDCTTVRGTTDAETFLLFFHLSSLQNSIYRCFRDSGSSAQPHVYPNDI